jgi:capsular exopolysaccharide synthesis family protein
MSLEKLLRVLRLNWHVLIAGALLGTIVGWSWASLQPKVYTATASALITAGVASDLGSALAGDNYAKSRVKSYQDIATSRAVASYAIQKLGLSIPPQALIGAVSVTNPTDTALLRVAASAGTPEAAMMIAEAWIEGMTKQVDTLEANGSSSANSGGQSVVKPSIVHLQTLDSAVLPTEPSYPNFRNAMTTGGAIGLIVGLALALVRFNLDKRVRSDKELEKQFGRPVLGVVPQARVVSSARQGSPVAEPSGRGLEERRSFNEALKKLRTNLQFMRVDNPPRIFVVTSSLPGEGKSTITKHLAEALASAGQAVVAIDADLRKPTLIKTFGLIQGAGLTDVLVGRVLLNDVLQDSGTTGRLKVLGPGAIPPNPSELLDSDTMLGLLREISATAVVLLDAPPLLPVTDAAILAARTDGAIVVVRAGKTTTVQLEQALNNLSRVSGEALGLVLNRVPMRGPSGDYYGYQYTGNYGNNEDKASGNSRRHSGSSRRARQGSSLKSTQ